jgi:hypothetical protein
MRASALPAAGHRERSMAPGATRYRVTPDTSLPAKIPTQGGAPAMSFPRRRESRSARQAGPGRAMSFPTKIPFPPPPEDSGMAGTGHGSLGGRVSPSGTGPPRPSGRKDCLSSCLFEAQSWVARAAHDAGGEDRSGPRAGSCEAVLNSVVRTAAGDLSGCPFAQVPVSRPGESRLSSCLSEGSGVRERSL